MSVNRISISIILGAMITLLFAGRAFAGKIITPPSLGSSDKDVLVVQVEKVIEKGDYKTGKPSLVKSKVLDVLRGKKSDYGDAVELEIQSRQCVANCQINRRKYRPLLVPTVGEKFIFRMVKWKGKLVVNFRTDYCVYSEKNKTSVIDRIKLREKSAITRMWK